MICPNCKREIDKDSNFCGYCGAKIEKCPSCGETVDATANYCTHCGKEIRKINIESDGGYYVPLTPRVTPKHNAPSNIYKAKVEHADTYKARVEPEDINNFQTNEPETPKKKANSKIISLSVIALVIATVVSYRYIVNDSTPFYIEDDIPTDVSDITIGGKNSLTSHTGNNIQEGKVDLTDDFIFMTDDSGKLVKMKRNLEDKEVLLDETTSYINVDEGVIYYANSENYLCSMDINGENNKVILKDSVYYLIAIGDKLYYQLDSDNESIHVYDVKTEKTTKLNDRASYNINITQDKIYYTSSEDVYQMNLDGSDDKKILSGKYYQLIYQEGFLYTNGSEGLIRYDVKNDKTETLIESVRLFNMNDEYIFAYSLEGTVIRYSLSNQEEKEIYRGSIQRIDVVGDKLILEAVASDNFQIIMNFDGTSMGRLFPENDGTFV